MSRSPKSVLVLTIPRYFILWLNDYTSRYSSTEATTLQLNHSIARAEATFFSSDSQYELNLAAGRVSQFYDLIGRTEENTKGVASSNQLRVPAHPDAFAAIRDDVDDMLRASARRFVRARSRNAGQQRAICVVFGGLFTIAIALAPLMLSHFTDRGRWIRFGIIPPLWLGLTVFLCSVNGICIILVSISIDPVLPDTDYMQYMLGGSRQLYPFELVRPPISAPIYQQPAYAASFSSVKVSGDVKSPQQSAKPSLRSMSSITQLSGVVVHGPYKHDGKTPANLESSTPEEYALPQIPAITPLTQEFGFETAGFIPSRDSCEELTIGGHSTYPDSSVGASSTRYEANLESGHHRGLSSTAKLAFDFDTLPIKKLDSNSGPPALEATYGGGAKGYFVKVFAPMTEVRSPVISRAQWEVVIRSGALAGFLTFIITAVLVAVPM